MSWQGIVLYVVAIIVGTFAVTQWRKSKTPVWRGLGLEFDKLACADLAIGTVIGALVMGGIFTVEIAMRLLDVHSFQSLSLVWFAWFPLFVILAFGEEIIYRSLMLNGLLVLLRKPWFSVIVMAACFGLAHAGNPNSTPLSVLGNTLGGFMYGIAFLGTMRIWLPLGLHFAWNFVQYPVLGFPLLNREIGLLHVIPVGSVILNGGIYGPEAGLIGMAFRFVVLVLLVIWFWYRSKWITQERSE